MGITEEDKDECREDVISSYREGVSFADRIRDEDIHRRAGTRRMSR